MVYNLSTFTFDPLPAGIRIELVDFNTVFDDEVLDDETTNAQGRVRFDIPDFASLSEEEPDLFFKVVTSGTVQHAGHTLPKEWSTKGWLSRGGQPGYYENFKGPGPLGSPGSPLVFAVGLDFHVALRYRDNASNVRPSPPKVRLNLMADDDPALAERTDEKGEVHAVSFLPEGGDDVHFEVVFQTEDPSINLPSSVIDVGSWETDSSDADQVEFPDNDKTSIGTQAAPVQLLATQDLRNVALFWIKVLREVQGFFFNVTNGDWTGIDDLEMNTSAVSYTHLTLPTIYSV